MKRGKPWWLAAVVGGSLVGIGLVVLLAGSSSSPDEDAAVETTSSTVQSRSTVTTRPTPPTTRRTTTVPTTVPVEFQRTAFAGEFEDRRSDVIAALEENSDLQSVDRVEFDPATDTILVAVTSQYSTEEINNDVAWEITTAFASFWEEDGMAGVVEFPVALDLNVSNLSFTCPGDFMTRLADRRAARSDWVATC